MHKIPPNVILHFTVCACEHVWNVMATHLLYGQKDTTWPEEGWGTKIREVPQLDVHMCRYKIIHLQVPICMWFANLCLVVMQSRETLLHGCAILGHSELLKELVTQYHLNINQPNLVRTHCYYCMYVYYALWGCIQLFCMAVEFVDFALLTCNIYCTVRLALLLCSLLTPLYM